MVRGLAWMGLLLAGGAWAAAPGDDSPPVEARSLLGGELTRPRLEEGFERRQEELLAAARGRLQAAPGDLEAAVWVGRRTAYLGRYREAVEVYTRALERHPESAEVLRHRGHRFITLRRLDEAIADLERAAALREGLEDEVEPDGLPNDRNIPTSTLHTNIWYHLGLAHYLRGDLDSAEAAYRRCLELAKNPDMAAATLHWLYMTLRRQGRTAEAEELVAGVEEGWDVIENHDYHRLLLFYRSGGQLVPGAVEGIGGATVGYGVGNWHLYNGRPEQALGIFREIVAGDAWPAFGHIAAEAELARWR